MSAQVHLRLLGGDVYQLLLDPSESSGSELDEAMVAGLRRHVDALAGDTLMRGLILSSARPGCFGPGEGLVHLLPPGGPSPEHRERVRSVQALFQKVAELPAPTVAVIEGPCMGRGLELALACTFRIGAYGPAPQFHFPEVGMGLLPHAGGTVRLPRRLGLNAACAMLVDGRRVDGREALRIGLLDRLVPEELLMPTALALLATPERPRRQHPDNRLCAVMATQYRWLRRIEREGGLARHARARIVEVASRSLRLPVAEALALEEAAWAELAGEPVTNNLIRQQARRERAARFRLGTSDLFVAGTEPPIRRVAIAGAGRVGAGLAAAAAASGCEVLLLDLNAERLARGLAAAARSLAAEMAASGRTGTMQEAMDRIHPAAEPLPLGRFDLLVEALPEDLDAKRALLARWARSAPKDALLASCTSALTVSAIADVVADPGRMVGLHPLAPFEPGALVELVLGRETRLKVADRALAFIRTFGRIPAVVRDRPGLAALRLRLPLLLEWGWMGAEGIADSERDQALGELGVSMHPLDLADAAGAEAVLDLCGRLSASLGSRMAAPSGLLGFIARDRSVPDAPKRAGRKRLAPRRGTRSSEWRERFLLLWINEAARLVEEGVVRTADDADFIAVAGSGFPAALGGPLQQADEMGIARVVDNLGVLAGTVGSRYQPCALLQAMVIEGRNFYRH